MFALGPDSGWNPIDELTFAYDNDLAENPIEFVEITTNDNLANKQLDIRNCDELPEQKSNLYQNNLSTLKQEENNKEITSNDKCEFDHKVSCENMIDSNKKKFNLSLTKEQHSLDIDNKKLDIKISNSNVVENYMSETHQENVTKYIQNKSENISENYSSKDIYGTLNSDKSLNNNNIISDEQNEINNQHTDFCEFKTVIPNSIILPLPNRTSEEYNEKIKSHPNKNEQFNDKLHYDINFENNLDSEFDEFSDFHSFNSVAEKSDVCQFSFESNAFQNNEEIDFNIVQMNCVTDNKNHNLKSDNFNNVLMFKSNDILNSESSVQINYKNFCKDAFNGDYVSIVLLIIYYILYFFNNLLLFRNYVKKLN